MKRLARVRGTAWSYLVIAVVCLYLGGLLATNLVAVPLTTPLAVIFPHLGGTFDDSSLQAEWRYIQSDYVLRGVPASLAQKASEQALVQTLDQTYGDRFTTLFTAKQYRQFDAYLNQQRTGSIGITLEERCAGATLCGGGKSPTVIAVEQVLLGQPADRAGLRNGDVLEAVQGKPLSAIGGTLNQQLQNLSPLIRGKPGTTVSLTVLRHGRTLTLTATRANLDLPTVYGRMLGTVLDLQVVSFGSDTGQQAIAQLKQGLAHGAKGVVLDLRGNGGGYVDQAVILASQFLTRHGAEQDVVVRRGRMDVQGRPGTAENVVRDPIASGGLSPTIPLVLLVDGGTASAAEIVTLALRDYHRATVVGTRTYGKGSVQVDYPLPNGDDLHLTVERWYGPDGESIDGKGITPDDVVGLPSPDDQFTLAAQSAPPSEDPQLQAALAILRSGTAG